jgi:hypothetical protein
MIIYFIGIVLSRENMSTFIRTNNKEVYCCQLLLEQVAKKYLDLEKISKHKKLYLVSLMKFYVPLIIKCM